MSLDDDILAELGSYPAGLTDADLAQRPGKRHQDATRTTRGAGDHAA